MVSQISMVQSNLLFTQNQQTRTKKKHKLFFDNINTLLKTTRKKKKENDTKNQKKESDKKEARKSNIPFKRNKFCLQTKIKKDCKNKPLKTTLFHFTLFVVASIPFPVYVYCCLQRTSVRLYMLCALVSRTQQCVCGCSVLNCCPFRSSEGLWLSW